MKNVDLVFRPVEVIGYHVSTLMVKRPDLFAEELVEVRELIARGAILPEEPEHIRLEDAPAAIAAMEERKTVGKIVIAF